MTAHVAQALESLMQAPKWPSMAFKCFQMPQWQHSRPTEALDVAPRAPHMQTKAPDSPRKGPNVAPKAPLWPRTPPNGPTVAPKTLTETRDRPQPNPNLHRDMPVNAVIWP